MSFTQQAGTIFGNKLFFVSNLLDYELGFFATFLFTDMFKYQRIKDIICDEISLQDLTSIINDPSNFDVYIDVTVNDATPTSITTISSTFIKIRAFLGNSETLNCS